MSKQHDFKNKMVSDSERLINILNSITGSLKEQVESTYQNISPEHARQFANAMKSTDALTKVKEANEKLNRIKNDFMNFK